MIHSNLVGKNPHFIEDVKTSFQKQGILKLLGAKLEKVELGLVEISLPFKPELTQHTGFFHAGVTTTIADTAGGYAAFTLFPPNALILSVEFKINLLNPAQGQLLYATGRVIKSGKTLSVCEASVSVIDHNKTFVCAHMLQTVMCLPPKTPDKTTK